MQCLWLCFNTSAVRWDMAAGSGCPAKPEIFTKCLLISPQSNVHRYTDKILSVNTYCSFLQSCKETTHGSIKKSMDVHTAVTPCHGFLHSNKKEWIINMYNIRESNPLHRVEGGRQKTALTECFLLDKVTENGKWSIMTEQIRCCLEMGGTAEGDSSRRRRGGMLYLLIIVTVEFVSTNWRCAGHCRSVIQRWTF